MSSGPETGETLANETLARTLAEARTGGYAIAAPIEGLSSADAYSVQHRVRELLGSRQIGWKVGSTSNEAQARLGTDEPGSGALLERYCYEDGAEIPVSPAHDVFVEVEFAVRFGRTLEPRTEPYTYDDLRFAVSGVMPALEIVGSRFESGLCGAGQALVTADGGANIAFAAGKEVLLAANPDLAGTSCELLVNGVRRAEGNGARALRDPFNVLVWLANHLCQRDQALPAGSVVSTGTCTGLVAVAPGDVLEGHFAGIGKVSVTLTDFERLGPN
jgi:2-keto-4-pentenoate hydratase